MPFRVGAAVLVALVGFSASCANPAPQPSGQPPPVPPPLATGLSPSIGTTNRGTVVRVAGSGFQAQATVTLGGIVVDPKAVYVFLDGTTIQLSPPAHAAGTVDVIVTNPDGKTTTLVSAYVYAPPDSFDLNGSWKGGADPFSDYTRPLNVTIQNNELVSFSCGSSETITPSPRPQIGNGEFLFVGGDGVSIGGRILSTLQLEGTVNVASCLATTWFANAKNSPAAVR